MDIKYDSYNQSMGLIGRDALMLGTKKLLYTILSVMNSFINLLSHNITNIRYLLRICIDVILSNSVFDNFMLTISH